MICRTFGCLKDFVKITCATCLLLWCTHIRHYRVFSFWRDRFLMPMNNFVFICRSFNEIIGFTYRLFTILIFGLYLGLRVSLAHIELWQETLCFIFAVKSARFRIIKQKVWIPLEGLIISVFYYLRINILILEYVIHQSLIQSSRSSNNAIIYVFSILLFDLVSLYFDIICKIILLGIAALLINRLPSAY